jgi:hypothetical protein
MIAPAIAHNQCGSMRAPHAEIIREGIERRGKTAYLQLQSKSLPASAIFRTFMIHAAPRQAAPRAKASPARPKPRPAPKTFKTAAVFADTHIY